ncbi:hypothetical protein [Streptomyces chromofuscus]|uniref:Uncharacterized protein n=1 Tax=Streptomyces chromofuscus TaxID=42881 RepID=A0A7M2THS1_STRCW|nr:hypothetical protein [Streptomyces chromofuscus]QOV47248.1 hypothetical protein IPT68_16045 [Streptomyces chromofuscus]GGT24482.1 hypothetical protein GCM10010254_51120 [Streptomyces chromofuscus]
MDLRGRKLKLTAVAALVVLTLTGFSTGRHSGGSGGGGGGGCSSSGQNHDSSSSTSGGGTWSGTDDGDDDYDYGGSTSGSGGYDDSDDNTGSSGSGSAETLRNASVKLVKCVTGKAPYSRVEITNPNASTATFAVDVTFENRMGATVKQETWFVEVPGDDTITVDIESSNRSRAAEVAGCDVDEVAEPEQ